MRNRLYLIVLMAISGLAFAGSYEDFFVAIHRDNPNAINALLARGFDPNARDKDGQPALNRALQLGSWDAADALVKAPGLHVNEANNADETPLMMAALKGRIELCEALIARGAAIDRPGWTPLHYAAAGDSLPAVRMLLARHAKVNARAPNGRTPLMMAAKYASDDVVDALLAAGADRTLRESHGATAADLAERIGRAPMAQRLRTPGGSKRRP